MKKLQSISRENNVRLFHLHTIKYEQDIFPKEVSCDDNKHSQNSITFLDLHQTNPRQQ